MLFRCKRLSREYRQHYSGFALKVQIDESCTVTMYIPTPHDGRACVCMYLLHIRSMELSMSYACNYKDQGECFRIAE
jgi:hypothetical protein